MIQNSPMVAGMVMFSISDEGRFGKKPKNRERI